VKLSPADVFHGTFAAAAALVFLPQPFWAASPLYTQLLTEPVLLRLGAPTKLLFLFLGALFAWRSARLFEPGNPVRPTWMFLAVGITGFFLGQATLAFYQLVLGVAVPFPSLADVFFLLAYPLLILGFVTAILAYEKVGFPIGTSSERWALALLAGIVFAMAGVYVLRPILAAPISPLERFLNAAYPALDLVILVPVLILMRIALRFRGGSVVRVWTAVLLGFCFMCVGDVLFAYFSGMGQERLGSLVDLMFVWAYISVSRGAVEQHRLLTS